MLSEHNISKIGRCVDCLKDSLIFTDNHFICKVCRREFNFDRYGILNALPLSTSFIYPNIYKSKFYLRWLSIFSELIKDWHMYNNPFIRFFALSGHRKILKDIRDNIDNEVLLDIGCGNGEILSEKKIPHYIGLDSNLACLIELKKSFPHALAVNCDILNTPIRSESITNTISTHVLEHIYFLAEALQEVSRVMKPQGFFHIVIPTEGGVFWHMARRFISQPYLKKKFSISAHDVMDIEHINDAKRVIKFVRMHFNILKSVFKPFPFLTSINCNFTINLTVTKSK